MKSFITIVLTFFPTLFSTVATAALPVGKTAKLSLKSRSATRNTRRSLNGSTSNVALSDWFQGTDLQVILASSSHVQAKTMHSGTVIFQSERLSRTCRLRKIQNHFVRRLIIPSTVVFDTGSTELLLPTTLCTLPGCTSHKLFDPSKSTTFRNLSHAWHGSFETGSGVDPTTTWFTSGFLGSDAVSVGGLSVSDQFTFFITNQSSDWAQDPFDGILGMGFEPTAEPSTGSTPFFQHLINNGELAEATYGFYLSPINVGHAELTLGGVDPSRMSGPLCPIPTMNKNISQETGSWVANLTDIVVNGQKGHFLGQAAVLDTGTANIVAPTNEAATAFYKLVSPKIQLVNTAGIYAVPCKEIKDIRAEIKFDFSGVQMKVPSSQLSVGPVPAGEAILGSYAGRDDLCQTVVNGGGIGTQSGPAFDELWIIGATALKFYYTAWDYANVVVSVATTVQSM